METSTISYVVLSLIVYIATRWCCVVQLEGALSVLGWVYSVSYYCFFL